MTGDDDIYPTGAMRPSQQLGAAPGTTMQTEVVPGNGNGPEGIDGLEFASSVEAETAPRDGIDLEVPGFDEELDEDTLDATLWLISLGTENS